MDSASKPTRRLVLTVKYNNTVAKLRELQFFKESYESLFPDLQTVDLGDILFYFKFLFTNPEDEFKSNLTSVLKLKSVQLTNEQFEDVHKIAYPLINFLYTYI